VNPSVIIEPIRLESINATCFIRRQDPSLIPQLLSEAAQTSDCANLFMKMFYIFGAYGQDVTALQMQAKALEFRTSFRIVSPQRTNIKLLALVAAGHMMDNTPIDFLIENSDIQLELLYIDEHFTLPLKVPEHDILYVAIGESPKNNPILERLSLILSIWPRPVINNPLAIQKCARDVFYELMNKGTNILVAQTVKRRGNDITITEKPFTVRPVGSHAGEDFVKIVTSGDLINYMNKFSSDQNFYIADYIDYQNEDGQFRKYRIALIQGAPYICHLAISNHWVVHYFPSGMEKSKNKRHEEESEMLSFESSFAVRHQAAFDFVYRTLGLDYVVIDCAQSRTGELIIFEADSGAWVHATDPVEIFPYKPAAMKKVFNAFREMLVLKMSAIQ